MIPKGPGKAKLYAEYYPEENSEPTDKAIHIDWNEYIQREILKISVTGTPGEIRISKSQMALLCQKLLSLGKTRKKKVD